MEAEEYMYYYNTALMRATEAVAMGVSRADTIEFLRTEFPKLEARDRGDVIRQVFVEANEQGVEYEDIDPSWFRG